ncbi:MAG: hypothetical protein ACJATI_002490 [Halioglobus sp.]|jgi:hypothetical protein
MSNNEISTKSKWNQVIASKLKEGQTLGDLKTEYDSGIVMEPNIVAEEVDDLNHIIHGINPWINMATIKGSHAAEINTLALQALNHGANGLNLVLKSVMNPDAVLSNVKTEHLEVRLDCSTWEAEEIESARETLDVSIYPNVKWVGKDHVIEIHISETDRVAQYKSLLTEINPPDQYDIIVTLSKNLLFEIASLRAMRILLSRNDISDYKLIARYDVDGTNELGDYNLIEKTYKVMSGIMGCADAILTPYGGSEDDRLSINIHNVLELESGFKDVMDPVGGAYYVEKLVGEIIDGVEK